MSTKNKKGFTMPNNYVVIFGIIVLAMIMTYIIPAGAYDRVANDEGRMVVVDGSFHFVEQSPVGPFELFECISSGFTEVSDIIFFIVFAYAWISVLLKNGTFNAMVGGLIRKFGNKIELLIPVIMIFFGVLGSTMGMSEETYGLIPAFVGIAIALGYDAFIGTCMTYVAAATGFASATLNPFTIGVAMSIAEVEYPYGLPYRILIFCVFQAIVIWYVMRYARRIKADPTKSYLYGVKLSIATDMASKEELENCYLNKRQVGCIVVFLVTIFFLVYGTITWGWYINELSALFLISMIVSAIVGGGMGPNDIAQNFVMAAKDMMFGAMVVGLSRGIVVVLNSGSIIDSIIYGLSQPLLTMGETLGALGNYVSALGMLVVQNIVNFFIGSGSGQASAVMPIMAPLADMIGLTRQTAVLAFQFGDGYSNMFWPNGIFLISGLMGAPAGKWFKFVAPLFGIIFTFQCIFMIGAVAIGF
ncbi:MAG: YfcC family protein [Clostridia bacterium]|nr:YfcC family protein [Clostridia bacterium]MBQ2327378.1 YfcC family protein [Clostridia bacterium]MBQ5813293.1 YfcC family protein [Clostridia bacterium]